MKNLFIAGLVALALLTMSLMPKTSSNETYATVNVIEKSNRLIIRTTIDDQPSTVVNLKLDYVGDEDMVEFSPVLKELKKLNGMGYELINGSIASITYGSVKRGSTRPYHTYILKKKN